MAYVKHLIFLAFYLPKMSHRSLKNPHHHSQQSNDLQFTAVTNTFQEPFIFVNGLFHSAMAQRKFFIAGIFLIVGTIFFRCGEEINADKETGSKPEAIPASPYTLQEGKLVALVDNSLSSYFIYKGEPKGFEFEMLSRFAQSKNLKLEVKIIDDVDHILDSLKEGFGDLAAANLTISRVREENINFSEPLFRTRQVLVQRLPENHRALTADQIDKMLIRDPLDLENAEIVVRKNSSYYRRLVNFTSETNTRIEIREAPSTMVTENLISMVVNGEIDYTICDENIANFLVVYYKNLDVKTPMSLSQHVGWAVRKESSQLLDSINDWISREKGKFAFNVIFNNYFEPGSKTRRDVSVDYEHIRSGKISDYDELIRQYSANINWDWKLLSALIYKESAFNAQAQSWAGAMGLMQVMPRIADSYGIDSNQLMIPEINLVAGTRHLHWLQRQWNTIIPDSAEALKFTLASYNVGFGHVSDARRLAKNAGMNPDKWNNSVEQMLLLKSKPEYYNRPEVRYGYCRGSEPVNYVRDILEHYSFYLEFDSSPLLSMVF